ncbi:sugar phosphate isomerase/epimerase [Rhizobium sp. KVB221]|uniref:Sugar phosphate isomerase/epimerase n=1 Tax=Rhizobium setariae TaxID=2801340 RepID=A0A936YNP0_9HYPH|nr:sugar phosphate isomerase/epimerase [Rhizobium setariae]MBL0371464.1 sugar phosphate isomerase/epimerase [Rhizobium setariae]
MQVGIFAKTFAGADPKTVLSHSAAAGYGCVQYNFACSGLASMPDTVPEEAMHAIVSAMQATGMEIAALSATYNMIHPDRLVREAGMARLEVALKAAARLAIPLVTLCTGTRDSDDQWRHHPDNASAEAWRDLVTEMERAAAKAEALGIHLGIEPEQANVVQDAQCAVRLMREVPSQSLRIVFDPANLFEHASQNEARSIVTRSIDVLADRIAMAHAKDRDAAGQFVTAGQGIVDFPDLISRLKQAGFDGPVVTHGLEEHEAPEVARFLAGLIA